MVGRVTDAARPPPKGRPAGWETLLGHIEPAAIFGGFDEVADSQLLAFLAAPVLVAHGIENVVQETAPFGTDVLVQINLLCRDLVSPAQLVYKLNCIVAIYAELIKSLFRRNAMFWSASLPSNQSDYFLFRGHGRLSPLLPEAVAII
jgi:hypothetical protein